MTDLTSAYVEAVTRRVVRNPQDFPHADRCTHTGDDGGRIEIGSEVR
jgi:hypothetical protein